jgi:hypothetical protein
MAAVLAVSVASKKVNGTGRSLVASQQSMFRAAYQARRMLKL